MVAFHFPPCRGSSGLQRALCFTRFLPAHGWNPIVLTAHPRAYTDVSDDQMQDVPSNVPVKRVSALDASRHLAFKGRYWSWTALPDRWLSWFFSALPAGLALVRRYRPKVIWSTYPIATAHLIGMALHRLTGIPWVADFRDPMIENNPVTGRRAPSDPRLYRSRSWVERHTIRHCARAVFVAPGAQRIYTERYASLSGSRCSLIANGYDEEAFRAAEQLSRKRPERSERLVLLHSGELYPTPDRDPGAFLGALSSLRAAGKISPANLKVVLRASAYDDEYRDRIRKSALEDLVYLEPAIRYREALAEMLEADGLLLFQGYTSNPAIPAKFYEYLRTGRPIFAMVDSEGDTAAALRAVGVGKIVPLVSKEQIACGLMEFLGALRNGSEPTSCSADFRAHSREAKAQQLAQVFESVIQNGRSG